MKLGYVFDSKWKWYLLLPWKRLSFRSISQCGPRVISFLKLNKFVSYKFLLTTNLNLVCKKYLQKKYLIKKPGFSFSFDQGQVSFVAYIIKQNSVSAIYYSDELPRKPELELPTLKDFKWRVYVTISTRWYLHVCFFVLLDPSVTLWSYEKWIVCPSMYLSLFLFFSLETAFFSKLIFLIFCMLGIYILQ